MENEVSKGLMAQFWICAGDICVWMLPQDYQSVGYLLTLSQAASANIREPTTLLKQKIKHYTLFPCLLRY